MSTISPGTYRGRVAVVLALANPSTVAGGGGFATRLKHRRPSGVQIVKSNAGRASLNAEVRFFVKAKRGEPSYAHGIANIGHFSVLALLGRG